MVEPAQSAGASALIAALLLACGPDAHPPQGTESEVAGAFDAASGVTRADSGLTDRSPRVIPLREMTGDVEILFGDPEREGQPFVMRIRELPGTRIPLHSHPVDEHITVVEGTWYFAVGDSWDEAALQELKAGTYAFAPKGSLMYGASPDGAIVQVSGIGPFHIHWRDGLTTLDDSAGAATFRFGKGERVHTGRATGTILQGYASGAIVQYEIEAEGGGRFMADEAELRRR